MDQPRSSGSTWSKKALSAFLSITLALLMFPTGAFGQGETNEPAAPDASTPAATPAASSDPDASMGGDAVSAGIQANPVDTASASDSASAPGSPAVGGTMAAQSGEAAVSAPPAAKSLAEVWVNKTNGSDAAAGNSESEALETLQAGIAAVKDGGTIHVKGNFGLTDPITIPAGVTLIIEGDVAMTGTGKNGLVFPGGTTLKCAPGGKLSMSGFATALTAQAGSTITDGVYEFTNNGAAKDSRGIHLAGAVKGSAAKDSVKITSTGGYNTSFYSDSTVFENATVSVTSSKTWFDQTDLTLKNASLKVSGYSGYYVNVLTMDNSEFTVDPYRSFFGGGPAFFCAGGTVSSSRITTLGGRTAGISVNTSGGKNPFTFNDSVLDLQGSPTGGLNVNTGDVVFNDSTMIGYGKNRGSLFGSQDKGTITFNGNSRVESPASKDADNGLSQSTKADGYVVLGGSYLVKYSESFYTGRAIPTNGSANGGEKLMLFTLADSSVNELQPINKNGATYSYKVATASSDGKKHVWVPAAKVTFKLNADDAASKVAATYADGTTADLESTAMRGYSLPAAVPAAGTASVPNTPVAIGYDFLGWFYKDGGVEKPFAPQADVVKSDMVVYAKWKANASSYGVVYHSNTSSDVTYAVSDNRPDRVTEALSFESVVAARNDFLQPGKKFKSWNTKPDGSGVAYVAQSAISVPEGDQKVDLYAQWEDEKYTVKFSANGGSFTDSSVFKTKPEVFKIEKDENGGEIATVINQATYQQKLLELLGDTDTELLKPEGSAVNPGYKLEDSVLWYGSATSKKDTFRFVQKKMYGITYPGENPEIKSDTTYYIQWIDDPSIEKIENAFTLDGDMWGADPQASNKTQEVAADTETFSLTGEVDVSQVKAAMAGVEAMFPDAAGKPESIALANPKSTFTATMTLPDGIVIPQNPAVTVRGLGNCFKVVQSTASGNEVRVVFTLVDGISNYKQLKDAVESTGGDDTISANSRAFGANATTLSVNVDGLKIDGGKAADDDELIATGSVQGSFSSLATDEGGTSKLFNFTWTAKQLASAANPEMPDTISHTLVVRKPVEMPIPADILVAGNIDRALDTTHDAAFPTVVGEKLKIVGAIDAGPVKQQMAAIEALYPNTKHDEIEITVDSFNFTAKLTLPEGLTVSDTPVVKGVNFGSAFTVKDVKKTGNDIEVTFNLTDAIANYSDLEKAVDSVGDGTKDWMYLEVQDVLVSSEVTVPSTLVVKGSVEGSFNAKAKHNQTVKLFMFKWNGVQNPEGKDVDAANDSVIQATLKVPAPAEDNLEGDILIGTETEHDAVFPVKAADVLTFTGAIKVDPVLEQMKLVERTFGNPDPKNIDVEVKRSEFHVQFTLPEGMSFTDATEPGLATQNFGPFVISSSSIEGKTLKIGLVFDKPEDIRTYADLKAAVERAGDENGWMKLLVPGVKMDVAQEDTPQRLTVSGSVKGGFLGVASGNTHREAFSFVWNAKQWQPGKDAIATDADAIQFTVEVQKELIPMNEAPSVEARDVTIHVGDPFDAIKDMVTRASDPEDGDLVPEVTYPEGFTTGKPGVYEIVFKVTDKAGATSTTTAKLTVLEKDAPQPGQPEVDKPNVDTGKVVAPAKKVKVAPQTGDSAVAAVLVAGAFGSLLVAAFALRARRRKNL